MRLWVTGAAGVLGSAVARDAEYRGHEVFASTHESCSIEDAASVWSFNAACRPSTIINCAGVVDSPVSDMILANAVGPANLASVGIRMVHMSTDGVYGAHKDSWLHRSLPPAPLDAYGRSKLAGEIDAPHVLNVRGSFIAPEGGLLKWLLDAAALKTPVTAWQNVMWNGTSVKRMAAALVELAEGGERGILHAASRTSVSKAELVDYFNDALGLELSILRVDEPKVWRVLQPDIKFPPVLDAMAEIVQEVKAVA